jgi:hypothetical protein
MTVYNAFSRRIHIAKCGPRNFLSLLLLVLIPSFATAQPPAKKTELLEPFIVRMSWISFDVINGRIGSRYIRRMQNRSLSLHHATLDADEHAVVRTRGREFSLKYELTSPRQSLQLQYDMSGVFQFDYQRFYSKDELGESYRVNMRQNQERPLEIEITRLNQTRIYQSNQIWLAMFAMSVEDRQCLIEILARLSPRLDLELRFNEVMGRLSRIAVNQRGGDYDTVRTLIKQLDSSTFAERQAADRQLRMIGRPLIGFLDGIDLPTLSTEQRARLGRISQSLISRGTDTVEQVVTGLRMNPLTWLVLANRGDPLLRRGALAQIEKLKGLPPGTLQTQSSQRLIAADVKIQLR